jgi:dipeptidyl aminopeptidase/acylaminoacyl peptidase
MFGLLFASPVLLAALAGGDEAATTGYRMPPKPIADLADAPPTPAVSVSPDRQWLLLVERPGLPPIRDLARAELKLAGLRFDPRTNGPSRASYGNRLVLKRIDGGAERVIEGLPEAPRISHLSWSPDGRYLAWAQTGEASIELWIAEVATARARRLMDASLSAVYGAPFQWMPDSRALVCKIVPPDRGPSPEASPVPTGPVIQEASGRKAPARTYQDLLRNAHDAALFEHHVTVQAVRVTLEGKQAPLGEPGMLRRVEPAPGGDYLLCEVLHRPFSYLVPASRFPYRVEVWDRAGKRLKVIADLPLAEEVPIAFDAVPTGPRAFGWRADTPATLHWTEAADGGDPKAEATVRDRVFLLAAPFTSPPTLLATLGQRYAGLRWGSDDLALVMESWWATRNERTWILAPGRAGGEPRLLWDRSWEDRYGDPGTPLTRPTPAGTRVLLTSDDGAAKAIFLAGAGASPEGDRPFLDRLDLATRRGTRLWRSEAPYYERLVEMLDPAGPRFLTLRESLEEPPNVFLRAGAAGPRPLTRFPHPAPQLVGAKKELIRYPREDGVALTGTLYLPPGYTPAQGPLPLLMWAYPHEFKSADAAGQVTDSPYRFARPGWGSPLFWLTQGFAVLDDPSMPIVGEGKREPNDTYVEQLVASARAAVAEVVRRGVADPERIAVGGHSYGAFMTANLLAHSDLFRAGIARSGAYNRTLTPFGFQAEERTLWEAPEVYARMSPFMHAEKIREPILLIHGEADNNSGTFPLQSERLFNALKGHGATARLVLLPLESHGYQSRESVMHMLWEITEWLETHVKNGRGRGGDGARKP